MSSLTHLAALGGNSSKRQSIWWESQTIVALQADKSNSNEIITVVIEGEGLVLLYFSMLIIISVYNGK